jgi:radical SAM superfamily enzyme YgiQ (UPF0313 family)
VRTLAPERVAAIMADGYHRFGLRRFYFVDNVFNHSREYSRRLCLAIKELNLPLELTCLINPAFPNEKLFHLIREAGGTQVQVGNESGADLVLTNLGKGFGRRQIEETLQLLQRADLRYTCFLLIGGPGETPATVQESVALLEGYSPFMVNLKAGIRICPHTALYDQALAEGVITPGTTFCGCIFICPRKFLTGSGIISKTSLPVIPTGSSKWIEVGLPSIVGRHSGH